MHQDVSIINYKCYMKMLYVEFGAGLLGMPASGRHSHKGHRGSSIPTSFSAAAFSLVFALRVAD